MKKFSCLAILFFLVSQLFSQKYTMSGYLSDKSSGEVLIGATIYNPKPTKEQQQTLTDFIV